MKPMVFQVDQRKVISRGKEIYDRIREKLESEHKGEIVAIEVDSGDYFLGQTVPFISTDEGQMTLRGSVDEYGHCWVPVTIVGLKQEVSVEAILDTGFDGWVCLPMRLAVQLGLELWGFQTVELADGTQKEELVFSGEVVFGDERDKVDITLTSGGDTLVGLGLLADNSNY